MSDGDITPGQIDPITFEVLRNAFMSIVDEMGLMLERVGHSLVVSEGRDFSAAICDADGRMIAEGKDDLPAHVGTLPFTVKGVIDWVGKDDIHEGDIFIMNDAYIGGTHYQDVRTIMPVFRDGKLLAFVQNSAHWSDVGGPVPGSFHAEAESTYGEALYITPLHLVRAGELDEEVLRFILRNVRVPDTTRGDVFAQIASCRTGEARLQSLIDKYGVELILSEMSELIRYSEALLREEFRKLPDGTYSFEDAIDFDLDRRLAVARGVEVDRVLEAVGAVRELDGTPRAGAPPSNGSAPTSPSLIRSTPYLSIRPGGGRRRCGTRRSARTRRPASSRDAHVAQDEAQDLVVEFALAYEEDRRDVERLTVGRRRLGVEAARHGAAGVRPVRRVLNERHELPAR